MTNDRKHDPFETAPYTENFVFSMEDEKRKSFNQLLAKQIIDSLPCDLTYHNCLPFIQSALNLGVKPCLKGSEPL
jgi:hypothetical protein